MKSSQLIWWDNFKEKWINGIADMKRNYQLTTTH